MPRKLNQYDSFNGVPVMLDINGDWTVSDMYEGRPRRTKQSHPYSYDPIVIFATEELKPGEGSGCYSDRLYQWDSKKHDRLCEKHFGDRSQYWNSRSPKKIEAFLQEYHGIPDLKLVNITEWCNQSSGYPCWSFQYKYDTVAAEARWKIAQKK